jgi:polyhydroxybutyrate depolymerase
LRSGNAGGVPVTRRLEATNWDAGRGLRLALALACPALSCGGDPAGVDEGGSLNPPAASTGAASPRGGDAPGAAADARPPENVAGAPEGGAASTIESLPDSASQPSAEAEGSASAEPALVGDVVAVEPIDPPVPNDCVREVAPGLHTVTCGGEVTFTYYVPEICAQRACGLIVDVHGFCMNANQLDENTHMRALGERHGFLVVQPTAPGGLIPEWTPRQDPEIHAFVDRMVEAFHVNERRIHVAGYSQGGSMTWRFICESQERYASFAPSSGGPNCDNFSDPGYVCLAGGQGVPDRQAPVLYQHGRFDVRAPFACAERNRDELVGGWNLSLASVLSEDELHSRTRYVGEAGLVFEFVDHGYRAQGDLLTAIQVDGHCVPGGTQVSPWPETFCPVYLSCDGEPAYRWGEEVIDFFIRHPRR